MSIRVNSARSEVRLLDIGEAEPQVFTRWDITGHQVNRHLLSKALTGTDDVVCDHMTFPPGFVHHMHRHPYADMVIIPLSGGVVQFLGASGSPVEVAPGHVLVIPRGNWHEISNVSSVDSQVLHFFVGVGSVDDIGYEAYEGQGEASRIAWAHAREQSMRIAIIGVGRMGRALADRLLDDSHEVSVWNRTPGRAAELQERGARVLGSVDDVHEESDAVLLCLADDRSTLDVATPKGEARASWAQTLVVNTATVAPDAITALVKAYGDRFVAAEILGAPQAVRSGTATFVVGGPASAREALAPLWNVFAGVLDVGDRPQTAAIMKLLNNQMLLAQVAVIAETVRAGRAAGIDDTTLAATLRESKMMPEGLRNRIDVLFDPDHAGWFNSVQAVKDVTLALELAQGGAPLPVTEAARDAYRQVVQDGWQTHDVTTLVEYGRLAVPGWLELPPCLERPHTRRAALNHRVLRESAPGRDRVQGLQPRSC